MKPYGTEAVWKFGKNGHLKEEEEERWNMTEVMRPFISDRSPHEKKAEVRREGRWVR